MMKKRRGKFKNRIYIYGLYNLNNIMCRCFKHDLNVFRALKRIKYSFFSFLGNFSKMSFFEHMSSFYFELFKRLSYLFFVEIEEVDVI